MFCPRLLQVQRTGIFMFPDEEEELSMNYTNGHELKNSQSLKRLPPVQQKTTINTLPHPPEQQVQRT